MKPSRRHLTVFSSTESKAKARSARDALLFFAIILAFTRKGTYADSHDAQGIQGVHQLG